MLVRVVRTFASACSARPPRAGPACRPARPPAAARPHQRRLRRQHTWKQLGIVFQGRDDGRTVFLIRRSQMKDSLQPGRRLDTARCRTRTLNIMNSDVLSMSTLAAGGSPEAGSSLSVISASKPALLPHKVQHVGCKLERLARARPCCRAHSSGLCPVESPSPL